MFEANPQRTVQVINVVPTMPVHAVTQIPHWTLLLAFFGKESFHRFIACFKMPSVVPFGDDCLANLPYIRRNPLYETEKAYTADCSTDDIPQSNIKNDLVRDINITDLRPSIAKYDFIRDGFQMVKFESSLKYEEFSDMDKVHGLYCTELGGFIKELLGASFVHVFEAQV